MLATLIFAVGMMPPLLSVWIMRRSKAKTRAKLRQAMTTRVTVVASVPIDRYYLEGVGYLIGDISCQFNARSTYLRCAVNPQGPCQACRHYESL